jgi:acetylornithine deacetylase/succinyl-diaminopimelate desuccinylase-like protein
MNDIIEYINNSLPRFQEELSEFLAIPSISTAEEHKQDVQKCADWLQAHLERIGMQKVVQYPTKGHPIVYAEWLGAGEDKPTVLFYGHYDVQPVDPLNLWTNPPFEPTVRDGKIFARGATDDKGQVFLHIKCIEAWLAVRGNLPVNVKLLIEGEEEIGSMNLEPFVNENQELLSNSAVVISDTAMYQKGQPSIVVGLRGLCYMEVHVTGPNRDLHSGVYGGAVQNPVNALATIIAKLKDEFGRIQIPGFYDDVVELTLEERAEFTALGNNDSAMMNDLQVQELFGEDGFTTLERIGARPTLDVNGMIGGFTGQGAKTVLPSKASAKISMRLVANQDTNDIADKFKKYVETIAPKGISVEVDLHHGANPVLVPRNNQAIASAHKALERAFGKTPVYTREGGSIPITLLFSTILKSPVVLMGFGLNTENLHSPDEHFDLENFHTGIIASAMFYEEMSL